MSNHVVVVEIGLTKNRFGAEIRTSEPMSLGEARAFALEAARGQHPDFAPTAKETQVLRAGADQYLVVEGHRLNPDSLNRFTVTQVVDPS